MKTSIQLDDLKPKGIGQPLHWNDWYFTASFNHKGKDYFIVLAVAEGTFMGGYGTSVGLSSEPFSPVQEEDCMVAKPPRHHFHMHHLYSEDAFTVTEGKETVTVKMGYHTAVCGVREQKLIVKSDDVQGELTTTPRGPVLRWGDKVNGKCPVTEGTSVNGIESLSDVRGTLTIKGEPIEVKGRGVFEHVWIDDLAFMKIRVMDWIYANFDQMYMFTCHCESISDDGTPYHFEDGTLYLIEEDDYMVTRKIDIMPQAWVYLAEARRFVPSQQQVRVETDKGVLEMTADISLYPQVAQAMRLEPLTMHSVTGWSVLFFDVPIRMAGTFTYKNGKTVALTRGEGVNEQLRILPL